MRDLIHSYGIVKKKTEHAKNVADVDRYPLTPGVAFPESFGRDHCIEQLTDVTVLVTFDLGHTQTKAPDLITALLSFPAFFFDCWAYAHSTTVSLFFVFFSPLIIRFILVTLYQWALLMLTAV